MSPNPDLSALSDAIPFGRTLGIEILEAVPERVVATMPWSEDKTTLGGRLHGGSLMAFADNVGAICAFHNLPDGMTTSTIESKTNFFRGVGSGKVTATSVPLHVGGTTIVVRTDLVDDRGKAVAVVTQTQIVIRRRAEGEPPPSESASVATAESAEQAKRETWTQRAARPALEP